MFVTYQVQHSFFVLLALLEFLWFMRLFFRTPFSPTLVAFAFLFFSFALRPLFAFSCVDFNPFYTFSRKEYLEGVYLGHIGLLVYLLGLTIVDLMGGAKKFAPDYNFEQLDHYSSYLVGAAVLSDVVCLVVFGSGILPGVRQSGLSKAANGAQVFFAITSCIAFMGVALSTLSLVRRGVRMFELLKLGLLFSLSMLFYQRGAFITGLLFGLFLAYRGRPLVGAALLRNFRLIVVLVVALVVILQGRALVSFVGSKVSGTALTSGQHNVASHEGLACKVSSSANQEHDQVWPTVLRYTAEHGFSWYASTLAAIARPFLSAERRSESGLVTSVDALNIYNDSDTYLDRNFGFSLSFFQYHYYSVGLLFFFVVSVLTMLARIVEYKLIVMRVGPLEFSQAYMRLQLLLLLIGAVDERLKWSVFAVVMSGVLYFIYRVWAGFGRKQTLYSR